MAMRIAAPFAGFVFSAVVGAVAKTNAGDLAIEAFSESTLPQVQCGGWYYHPADQKTDRKVIAVGESPGDFLQLIVNGDKVVIGNWRTEYRNGRHGVSYGNERHRVNIDSVVVSDGRYSAEYRSTINLQSGGGEVTITAYGLCGC